MMWLLRYIHPMMLSIPMKEELNRELQFSKLYFARKIYVWPIMLADSECEVSTMRLEIFNSNSIYPEYYN